jgi:hypothetical protein
VSQAAGNRLVGVGATLIMCVLAAGGCASHHIVMRHPDGRQAQCDMGFGIYAPGLQRDCVRDFQRQGYERVSD